MIERLKTTSLTLGLLVACDDSSPSATQRGYCSPATPVDGGLIRETLVNLDCEPNRASLIPIYPDQAGQRLSTRLTPTQTPFTVERIGYFVTGDGDLCVAGLAHTVELAVHGQLEPPLLPVQNTGQVLSVERPPVANQVLRPVVLPLDPPIRLLGEESLFVSIVLAQAGGGRGLCLRVSPDAPREQVDYVTRDLVEPYTWEDLNGPQGLGVNLEVFAVGTRPAEP